MKYNEFNMKTVFIDGSICHLSSSFNENAFKRAFSEYLGIDIDEIQIIHYGNISGKHIINKLLEYNYEELFNKKFDYALIDLTYVKSNKYLKAYINIFKQITNNLLIIDNLYYFMDDDIICDVFKDKKQYLIYRDNPNNFHYIHFAICEDSKYTYYKFILNKNILHEVDFCTQQISLPFTSIKDIKYKKYEQTSLFDLTIQKQKYEKPIYVGRSDLLYSNEFSLTINDSVQKLFVQYYNDYLSNIRTVDVIVNQNKIANLKMYERERYIVNSFQEINIDSKQDNNRVVIKSNNIDFLLTNSFLAYI